MSVFHSGLLIEATCLTCGRRYEGFVAMIQGSPKPRAMVERSNRAIWAQTHCDLEGHSRFSFTDTASEAVIVGRSPQMTLKEDPGYSTVALGAGSDANGTELDEIRPDQPEIGSEGPDDGR